MDKFTKFANSESFEFVILNFEKSKKRRLFGDCHFGKMGIEI